MSQATATKSLEDRQDAAPPASSSAPVSSSLSLYKVLRRDGSVAEFEPTKISVALTKAFIAIEGEAGSSSSKVRDVVARLTEQVVHTIKRRLPEGGILHIEHIQ